MVPADIRQLLIEQSLVKRFAKRYCSTNEWVKKQFDRIVDPAAAGFN
jgi:hypothetical protein